MFESPRRSFHQPPALGLGQFVRIGRLAMVGGMSKIVQDVPPFVLIDGGEGEPFLRSVEASRGGWFRSVLRGTDWICPRLRHEGAATVSHLRRASRRA